jgi:hypothetical protein
MKASEVRLGNLIYGVSDRIETVIGIGENSITAYAGKLIKAKMEFPEKDFRPIPLTEEWLVRFGFSCEEMKGNQSDFRVYRKGRLTFNTAHDSWWYNNMILSPEAQPNHVHTLQNLFYALNNEELALIES